MTTSTAIKGVPATPAAARQLAAGCRFARDLRPGDTYLHPDTRDLGEDDDGLFVAVTPVVVVSGPDGDSTADPLGRTLMRFWVRDPSTGHEGSSLFGPDGVVRTEITDRHWMLVADAPTEPGAHYRDCTCRTCRASSRADAGRERQPEGGAQ